jgi:DNA ligase (NAD+)
MKAVRIIEPDKCPFCGAPVVRLLDEGAHIYCSNPDCEEKKLQKLNYFVTKQCMNIDGLSEKTLRKLQESGRVKEWKDLYEMDFDDFVCCGLGNKTALKLVDELKKSTTEAKAENVLMALGIPMIGKVTAIKLLEHFKSIVNIEMASLEEIANVEGVGDVAAKYVYDYMKANKKELEYVYKYLQYSYATSVIETASHKLDGLTIMATGTLKNFSRDGIKDSIVTNGGKYASGVSKKLSFLIVGEAAGESKLNKAKELNIKMITEDEYLDMIK